MALKFSMILEAVDRASAPTKRVRSSMAGLVAGAKAWGQQVRKTSQDINSGARSLQFYETRARRLRQVAVGRSFQAIADGAGRAARRVTDLAGRLRLVERGGNGLKALGGKLGGMAANAAKWGGAAAVAASSFALFDLFSVAGKFEQLKIQLEGMYGSTAKANEAFRWIKTFAKETPFELEEVTKAFVVLKNAGLEPMKGGLREAGDAAAGMSSDVVEAAKAMADAMTGEFERLKDLGITASTSGNKVRLSWVKNEREVSKVVEKTDKVALAMAVAAGWSDKFAGSTKRQSQSFFGMISNLKDSWTDFLSRIADAGIFESVKKKLQGILEQIAKWGESGQLDIWAQNISDGLEKAWQWADRFINDTDWTKVGNEIKDVAKAVTTLAEGINGIASFLSWGDGVDKALNKAVSGAARFSVDETYGRVTGRALGRTYVNPNRKGMQLLGPQSAPAKPAAPALSKKIGFNEGPFNGRMVVEVRAAGGAAARVVSMESKGGRTTLAHNTGRIMTGPA